MVQAMEKMSLNYAINRIKHLGSISAQSYEAVTGKIFETTDGSKSKLLAGLAAYKALKMESNDLEMDEAYNVVVAYISKIVLSEVRFNTGKGTQE